MDGVREETTFKNVQKRRVNQPDASIPKTLDYRIAYCDEESAAGAAGAGAGALMFTCGAGALGAGKMVVLVSVWDTPPPK